MVGGFVAFGRGKGLSLKWFFELREGGGVNCVKKESATDQESFIPDSNKFLAWRTNKH